MPLAELFGKLEKAVDEVNSKRKELDTLQAKKDFEVGKLQQQIESVEKNYETQLEAASKAYTYAYENADKIRNETQQLMSGLLPALSNTGRVRVG